MTWIYAFDDPLPDARRLVGGKAESLRTMTAARLPVPPGFTITTEACRAFLAGGRWPEGLDKELRFHLARLEAKTGCVFGRDLLVSVRSGAAVSMPGMMDTLLNVGRPEELNAAIDQVFQSWNSDRARTYRRRHDVRGLEGTSATIQAMFPSEIAGVVFTLDVDHPESDRMIVEAARGLGEAVVSGAVTPERFAVSRAEPRKIERLGGGDSGLDPGPLADLALKVEALYGQPVDIEWGFAGGRFVLLQARPVRGLEVARAVAPARRAEIERLRGRRGLWVAHNLGETLRAPTPLTWDIVRRFMSGEGGYGRLFKFLGYRPHAGEFLELIGGRIYADPERLANFFWDGLPLGYDPGLLKADPRAIDRAPGRFEAERADARFLTTLPANLAAMWRAARRVRRVRAVAAERFEREILPAFEARLQQERARDLTALGDEALRSLLHEQRRFVLDEFGPESLLPGFLGGLAFESLRTSLRQILGEAEGETTAQRLVQGEPPEQEAMLARVGAGEATLEEFLERYGHRCAGEMELAEPRWIEDPEPVVQAARRRSARPPRADGVDLPALLAGAGASSLRESIERDLADARRLLPYRESGKHHLMKGYALLRRTIEEMARRWDLGRSIYFLTLEELNEPKPAPERRVRWQALQRLDLPEVIDSAELESLGSPRPAPSGDVLEATPIAPGVAEGTVRIVHDPREADAMRDGDVLVCPSTDPGWTPLLAVASALIVERGGVLSHGAIVARDFGVPAVCCPGATRFLIEGRRVRVDANTGRVVRCG